MSPSGMNGYTTLIATSAFQRQRFISRWLGFQGSVGTAHRRQLCAFMVNLKFTLARFFLKARTSIDGSTHPPARGGQHLAPASKVENDESGNHMGVLESCTVLRWSQPRRGESLGVVTGSSPSCATRPLDSSLLASLMKYCTKKGIPSRVCCSPGKWACGAPLGNRASRGRCIMSGYLTVCMYFRPFFLRGIFQ